MKKLISFILIALTTLLLSSCIIVTPDEPSRYSITCDNNTQKTITDWCVKKGEDTTYANSEYNCVIEPGERDKIKKLKPGYYSVCITFAVRKSLHPSDYEQTAEIYLDEDVVFDVAERKFYGRSVIAGDDAETEYVLIGSNGKEYPLIPAK